jgi:SAM-dependent methyltransferase
MRRLTDAQYWDENLWARQHPRRLWLYRDFDFETVRLLRSSARAAISVADGKSARVFELGAGGSRVLPYLARRFGYRVFGSDFSLSGCRLLRANLALQHVDGGVVCEDLFQSSLSEAAFDVVFSSGLVEHFDDTCAPVAEHFRLLKPGGRLVVIVPNFQGIQARIWRRLAQPLWRRHHIFGPAELSQCLGSIGLVDLCSGYLGSFLIQIGRSEEWAAVARWPRWLGWLAHYSVRVGNGGISLFFRLLPFRPHGKALSPAFFAAGTRPKP